MRFSGLLIAGFILCFSTLSAVKPPVKTSRLYVSNFENVLGTSMEIKFQAVSQKDADVAEDAALDEIGRLANILNSYNSNSEFSRWLKSENEPVKVSTEFYEVLSLFDKWRSLTNGALDASAEVAARVWKNAAAEQRLPSQEELDLAVETIKRAHWSLDKAAHTATHLDNAPLIFNSFVKSYIINRAAEVALHSGNITAVVVNIGGDIVVKGDFTEPIQVSDPRADAENDLPLARLNVKNKAVATSGNYRRGIQIGGQWYSHIIDPRSAKPAGNIISATVVSNDASAAGALATSLNVLNPEDGIALASSLQGIEAMIITKDGKRLETKGWSSLEVALTPVHSSPAKKESASAQGWDTSYELAINFEINTIDDFRSHRPYIAVWIENPEGKIVRNIALWYGKPRYLDELRAWSRVNNNGNGVDFSSISSATRSPGKYSLKWDGRDDKGTLVKPGKYTVNMEASREHGTHQMMSQEMTFNGTPAQVNLKSNIEIASATLDYRKKQSGK